MPTNASPPITAEDMMATSAFAVSPILTASIFDEIQTADIDDLYIGEHPVIQRLDEREPSFVPPPPSARWTRRLASLHRRHRDHIGPVTHPSQSFPSYSAATSEFITTQNCLNGRAVQTSPILAKPECNSMKMLDFDIVLDDGGQYGSMYGVENLLMNDGSVYCSGRKGAVNILFQYCGYVESAILTDTSCSINKVVLKAPHHGFTAPCQEGLIFISHKEINLEATKRFDGFDKQDYDEYMEKNDIIDDEKDPAAWFTIERDRISIVELNNRSGKYVMIKMLRSDHESDNIDLQYVGFIGFSGPRSFGCAKLC